MNTQKTFFLTLLMVTGLFAAPGLADTFKNKATGETFDGFMTQKRTGGKTLVYNNDKQEMAPLDLTEYEVTFNGKGRKDNVFIVPITQSEALLSQVVSETIAKTIIDASNKGPQAIIVQIDDPGGRGDYMKIICSAITQTTNCPVYAYISGKEYGGAFSAAALIAMACDKVFIAPTASIGAVAPFFGNTLTKEDFSKYISTYSSDSLGSYNVLAMALADAQNRPPLLVRALIDKHLSVEEVTDGTTRAFVQKDDRQPNQTRIRTLAEGVDNSVTADSLTQAMVVTAVLNLPATVAIEVGLADGTAESLTDVLAAVNLPGAQLTNASGIDSVLKKYKAARRNIAGSLSRIQWLEDRSSLLENQLGDIENQLRTGTVTREVTQRGNFNRRTSVALPENYDRYYYDPQEGNRTVSIGDTYTIGGRRDDRRDNNNRQTETVVTQVPAASITQVQRELVAVLNDLIVEYRRTMSQAKRWPGSLPPEIPYQTLEQNWNSAVTLRDSVLRQPAYVQPDVQQQQQAVPSSSGGNRNTRNRR